MRTRMTTRRWEISVRVAFSSSPSSSSSFAAVEYIIKRRRRPRDRLSLSSLWSYRLKRRRRRRRRTRRRGEQSVRDNATHLKEQTTTTTTTTTTNAFFYHPREKILFHSLSYLFTLYSNIILSLSLSYSVCCLRRVALVRTTCVRVNTDRRDSHARETEREFWGNDERPDWRERVEFKNDEREKLEKKISPFF